MRRVVYFPRYSQTHMHNIIMLITRAALLHVTICPTFPASVLPSRRKQTRGAGAEARHDRRAGEEGGEGGSHVYLM